MTRHRAVDNVVDQPANDRVSSQTNPPYKPWKVFPASRWEELKQVHGDSQVKLVHILRHAEGTHNVGENYNSEIDARLTEKGKQQCRALAETPPFLVSPQHGNTCILTSPLTRCVETALLCFPNFTQNQQVPIVAQEAWRETVNFNCDRRRGIDEIRADFSSVDFGECSRNNDEIWENYRQRLGHDWDAPMESFELHVVAQRALRGLMSLQERPESQIVVSTHSAFLRCMMGWGQNGGVSKVPPQQLDDRPQKVNYRLLDYAEDTQEDGVTFEDYMRQDYENCEPRSFCFLVQGR